METKVIRYVSTARKLLNGISCVYKPDSISMDKMRFIISNNLSEDLEKLECPDVNPFVSVSGETTKPMTVKVRPTYADDVLMTGPRFSSKTMGMKWPVELGDRTSGVCIVGLYKTGGDMIRKLYSCNFIRTYKISGRFGIRTHNFFIDGKLKYEGKYDFIKRSSLDALLAMMQGTYQKQMFHLSGVDYQSQTAYEMASRGPIRVTPGKLPVVYSIKCVEFNLPDFTLEMNCVNENEDFMINIIAQAGIKLRTEATCTSMRCIRYGNFTLNDALLRKHWKLEHVIDNIKRCDQLYNELDMSSLPENLTNVAAG